MYKITVQDGAVTVTVECEESNDAAATLAVATLLKVQRANLKPEYHWRGPDYGWRGGKLTSPLDGRPYQGYPPGVVLCGNVGQAS